MLFRNAAKKNTPMKFSGQCIAVTFLLTVVSSHAQSADLNGPPDAPTRIWTEESLICTVEGVKVTKKETGKGQKDVNVVFLLTQRPTAYFSYYDPDKKAVVFDFYDTRIGKSIFDSVSASPITASRVESFKIDLNKDVPGLKPDIRDVVRVSLFTPYDFGYDVGEDVGVITMSYKLGVQPQTPMVDEGRSLNWKLLLGIALAGALGLAAALLLVK